MIDFSSPMAWRRPFQNAKRLLFGRTVQAVLSIGYLALATRTLGVEGFGVLTLVQATVGLVGALVTFQTSQMILRYGARAITNKNPTHLKKIIRFGVKTELLAAGVGIIALWLLTEPMMALFSLAPEYALMMELYGFILFFGAVGQIAMGSLQLTDRHDLISWQLTASPVVKFLGAGVLFFLGAGVGGFLTLWFAAAAISNAILCILAWQNMRGHVKTLRQQVAAGAQPAPATSGRYGAPEKGLWNYVVGTNVNASIGVDIVPVLVASVLGPEGAGLIRIAQKIAGFIDQPVQKLLVPAVITDMTWLNAQGNNKDRRKLVIKTGAIAGCATLPAVLLLSVFGKDVITLVAGSAFVDAYGAMLMFMFTMVVGAFGFTLKPLLMTAGRVWSVTATQVFSLVIFIAITPYLLLYLGVAGAGVGAFLRTSISFILFLFLSRDLLRRS